MKTALYQYKDNEVIRHSNSDVFDETTASLALCFGAKNMLSNPTFFSSLRNRLPVAQIALCSTAGEIFNTEVSDDTISVAVIKFEKTQVKTHTVNICQHADSYAAGEALRNLFDREDLAHILILSDGSKVNGSELVRGLNTAGEPLMITGGLAGDGSNFKSTLVGLNALPEEGLIAGIGFYGKALKVNHGSQGGWEMFGLEKKVTRSVNNVLYEIENGSALELYKKYLGSEADSLPGSALLFPLSVVLPDTGECIVRTILSIDEDKGSMTFAGDIPEGAQVRFMRANFDKITNAASDAAGQSLGGWSHSPKLALLISCVGRKLILNTRTDEEVEAVGDVFGSETLLTGFYSYGEISPMQQGGSCQLHNQTMTITTFDETE